MHIAIEELLATILLAVMGLPAILLQPYNHMFKTGSDAEIRYQATLKATAERWSALAIGVDVWHKISMHGAYHPFPEPGA